MFALAAPSAAAGVANVVVSSTAGAVSRANLRMFIAASQGFRWHQEHHRRPVDRWGDRGGRRSTTALCGRCHHGGDAAAGVPLVVVGVLTKTADPGRPPDTEPPTSTHGTTVRNATMQRQPGAVAQIARPRRSPWASSTAGSGAPVRPWPLPRRPAQEPAVPGGSDAPVRLPGRGEAQVLSLVNSWTLLPMWYNIWYQIGVC